MQVQPPHYKENSQMDIDKTRILVVSDTHGSNRPFIEVLKKEAPFDMLIHCGDIQGNIYSIIGQDPPYQVYVVKGNCDYSDYPSEILIDSAGHRILVTHGHENGLNVRYSNTGLYSAAAKKHADVVLFGHTHVSEIEERNGIFLMNPGSLSQPRGSKEPTYGILELEKGQYPRMYINLAE